MGAKFIGRKFFIFLSNVNSLFIYDLTLLEAVIFDRRIVAKFANFAKGLCSFKAAEKP
jgi:hypothetical protein